MQQIIFIGHILIHAYIVSIRVLLIFTAVSLMAMEENAQDSSYSNIISYVCHSERAHDIKNIMLGAGCILLEHWWKECDKAEYQIHCVNDYDSMEPGMPCDGYWLGNALRSFLYGFGCYWLNDGFSRLYQRIHYL